MKKIVLISGFECSYTRWDKVHFDSVPGKSVLISAALISVFCCMDKDKSGEDIVQPRIDRVGLGSVIRLLILHSLLFLPLSNIMRWRAK